MTKCASPTNFRWAVCCQTCCHFHEAPVATGEGECKAVNPLFEVLAGNVCDLHKPSDDTETERQPYICPGCLVREPWEHRCCRDEEDGRMCECECQRDPTRDPINQPENIR